MKTIAALIALVLPLAALADGGAQAAASTAKQRRKELQRLDKELFNEELLVRTDLHGSSPAPSRERVTELADGSLYAHADSDVVFEKLTAVRISDMRLRKDGAVLLLELMPATRILTPAMWGPAAPQVASFLRLERPVDDAGVQAALETVLFLPGQSPTEAEIAECLARYPDHDARKSRLRCGLPAQ